MSRIDQEARNLLLRRREHLSRRLESVPPDPAASWRDWESLPAAIPEDARRELHDVEHALQRIAEGCYGTCQACGGPMGMQRIRAIPEARYCVTCSGHREPAE